MSIAHVADMKKLRKFPPSAAMKPKNGRKRKWAARGPSVKLEMFHKGLLHLGKVVVKEIDQLS